MVGNIILHIFSLVAMLGLYQLWLPPLSLAYMDGVLFFGICAIVLVFNLFKWSSFETAGVAAISTAVIWIVVLVGGVFIGCPLFTAETMHKQLGNVEDIEYQDMVIQIDTSQIPIVDEELAEKQADKKIGEDIALGSRINLGDAAVQEVNGEIMWVAPLEHVDVFKWFSNRSTPGYITVSASNPNKVEFVTKLDEDYIDIIYQQSAFFGNDLKRYIRSNGYRTVGLTEYTFELDDTGRPFWVVTTYKNRTLWGNGEATGVVIVDAQDGEIEWYSMDDAPDWVDLIQPKDFIENQIDNWGKLVHGVFNFANTDKIKKTDLTLTVYMDGDCYYFTGMTSVGADESCVGFILVNTRDKSVYMSYMSGATENAAMKAAEGLVSDFGYKSTEPLPINVNGIPTYVMALKDEEGLNKRFAMVNIENYSIAAVGATLEETKRAYMQKVAQESSTYAFSDEAYGYTFEGKVERISAVVENGSTQYYMIVEGEANKIFTASYAVSDELAITREGDTVKVNYVDSQNGAISIVSFDNIAFAETVSEKQEARDEMDEGTSALDSEYAQIIDVNPEMNEDIWNSLTDEEKAKLIEELVGKSEE